MARRYKYPRLISIRGTLASAVNKILKTSISAAHVLLPAKQECRTGKCTVHTCTPLMHQYGCTAHASAVEICLLEAPGCIGQ